MGSLRRTRYSCRCLYRGSLACPPSTIRQNCDVTFSIRPPSAQWEPISGADGSLLAWAWWKPQTAPGDLLCSIPPEQLSSGGLTARLLATAAGLVWPEVAGWVIAGQFFDAQQGANPLLDLPLPDQFDGQVAFRSAVVPYVPAVAFGPAAAPAAPAAATGPSDIAAGPCEVDVATAERMLAAIDADWQATLKLERDLRAKLKEVQSTQARVGGLTRDLNADERRFADSNDIRQWNDAKRQLRDAASKLSKQARDYELGTVSAAGARNRFEEVHRKYVTTKTPFAGITQVAKEFEQHRKTAQNLLQAMGAANSNAASTGEAKAKQILASIAAKARKARTKR